MKKKCERLSSGNAALDALLSGGFPVARLTTLDIESDAIRAAIVERLLASGARRLDGCRAVLDHLSDPKTGRGTALYIWPNNAQQSIDGQLPEAQLTRALADRLAAVVMRSRVALVVVSAEKPDNPLPIALRFTASLRVRVTPSEGDLLAMTVVKDHLSAHQGRVECIPLWDRTTDSV
jgi:hypothetical protein